MLQTFSQQVQNSCNQVGFGKWQLLSARLKDHKFSPHFYFNYIDTAFNLLVSEGMPNCDKKWACTGVRAMCRFVLLAFLVTHQLWPVRSWSIIKESCDLRTTRKSEMYVWMRKPRSTQVKQSFVVTWLCINQDIATDLKMLPVLNGKLIGATIT